MEMVHLVQGFLTGPSYPMGPLGPGPGPPRLRGPQTAHALFFIS